MAVPFGYRIREGRAVVCREELSLLLDLFRRVRDGESLASCARDLGRDPRTLQRMLLDRRYLGEGEYPLLVGKNLFFAAGEELRRRGALAAREKSGAARRAVEVVTRFRLRPEPERGLPRSPEEEALCQYRRIVPRGRDCG